MKQLHGNTISLYSPKSMEAYLGIVEGALPTLPGRVEEVSTLPE